MTPDSNNEPESGGDTDDQSTVQTDAETQASPSSNYKTRGKISASDGTGVLGHNTSTSGAAYGVEGVTDSTGSGAAGVRAVDRGGSTNQTYGLLATTDSTGTDSAAVEARATGSGTADAMRADATGGDGNGIHAIADSNGWFGVFAENMSGSGSFAYALYAKNNISTSPAIFASTSGGTGIESRGAIDAETGYRGPVGSAAFMSSDFSLTSNYQKVPFDTLTADQRGEFSTGNYWFECAYDGTYVVEFGLESFTTTSGIVTIDLQIDTGNAADNPAATQGFNWDFEPNGNNFANSYSRTIYGLRAGNQISVNLKDSAGNAVLTSGENETFMSVRQVGGGGSYTSSPASASGTTTSSESSD